MLNGGLGWCVRIWSRSGVPSWSRSDVPSPSSDCLPDPPPSCLFPCVPASQVSSLPGCLFRRLLSLSMFSNTPVFRLVVTKKRQESVHAPNYFPFKMPTKMCTCANSRCFFVTTNLQVGCHKRATRSRAFTYQNTRMRGFSLLFCDNQPVYKYIL